MKSITATLYSKSFIVNFILDVFALAFIFLIPSLAHLVSLPVYMIEPMRMIIILSLAHGTKNNAYFLALTLPFFSFLISGHPFFSKMLIITAELLLNVFLFFLLQKRIKHVFLSLFSAILISKLACYLTYLVFFSLTFLKEEANFTFMLVQLATTLIFSVYVYYFKKEKV